jgi:signal transduction histidine kinase
MDERMEKPVRQGKALCRPEGGWSRGGRWAAEADSSECWHHRTLVTVRRDLHDKIGSALSGIAVQLELAQRLVGTDAENAQAVLSEVRADIVELIAKVRRIGDGFDTTHQMRNIEAALRSMIHRANRAVAPRMKLGLNFDPRVSSVPEETRSAAFWIVWEAVVNVLKHSTARHCTVGLSVRDGELHVHVEDDGRATMGSGGGCGLDNMSARAEEQGGWCTAGPRAPMGFAVTACLPLPER